jgi:short-subunit dehydrogenase
MTDYRGQTALITGASSGMGAEYARQLASRGCHLILVARRLDKLQQLAAELTAQHGVEVTVLDRDLSAAGAGRALADEILAQGRTVDILINDAGFGTSGNVADQDQDVVTSAIALNISTVTELTRGFLPGMLERDKGVIINMASLAALQTRAGHALYSAAKAYVLSFTEALWGETISTNVRVTAVCPGPVDTEFFAVAGTKPVSKLLPASVPVAAAFAAIERRKPFVIVAIPTIRFFSKIMRLLPAKVALRMGTKGH